MADWPLFAGSDVADRAFANIGGAAANTKSPYTELIAALPRDAAGLVVSAANTSGSGTYSHLVDIAAGAAAAEQDIVSNVLCASNSGDGVCGASFYLPLVIPKGTRLSARAQCNRSSKVLAFLAAPLYGTFAPFAFHRAETYGADASDSGGAFCETTTANEYGPWVELTAATGLDVKAIALALGGGNVSKSAGTAEIQLGLGAPSSEQVVLDSFRVVLNSGTDNVHDNTFGAVPLHIPKGSRLSVRTNSSVTGSAGGIDVVMVAFG